MSAQPALAQGDFTFGEITLALPVAYRPLACSRPAVPAKLKLL